ncbi:MAG: mRNA 3'-end-processing protein RNA14 [Amphiamblys sp. WSBS2006]|nr:MAG: mRNA 3'-end-processing protein RNA14 [Amphiamblys sp. WSBS2006]
MDADLSLLSTSDWNTLLVQIAVMDNVSDAKKILWTKTRCPSIALAFFHSFCREKKYRELEELFSLVLEDGPAIHFLVYIGYLKAAGKDKKTILDGYEFAVATCRCYDVGDVWVEYIRFVTCESIFEEQEAERRMDYLRTLYSRGLSAPHSQTERVWRACCDAGFEGEMEGAYRQGKELAQRQERMYFDRLIVPSAEQSSEARRRGVGLESIQSEEAVHAKEGGKKTQEGVSRAYESVLNTFVFWEDLYLKFSRFLVEERRVEDAEAALRRGVEMLPGEKAVFLRWVYLMERSGKGEEAVCEIEKRIGMCGVFECLSAVRRVRGAEEAVPAFEKMKGHASSSDYFQAGKLFYNSLQRPDRGYRAFEEGMKRFTTDSEYFCSVVRFLYDKGASGDALLFLESLIENTEKRHVQQAWDAAIENERDFFGDSISAGLLEERKMKRETGRKYPLHEQPSEPREAEKERRGASEDVLGSIIDLAKCVPDIVAETIVRMPLFCDLEEPTDTGFLIDRIMKYR